MLQMNKASNLFVPAVGNSPLILDESPFWRIRQYLEPQFVVQTFDEFSKMEIRPNLGVSCRRLLRVRSGRTRLGACIIESSCRTHPQRFVLNRPTPFGKHKILGSDVGTKIEIQSETRDFN
jgi:hypothetical protein